MQKIKNNLLSILTCVLLAGVTCLNILTTVLTDGNPARQITAILIGLLFIVALSFAKEKHLHKAALPVYLCATLILIFQLVSESYRFSFNQRYLFIGSYAFLTASLLPLTSIQVAKKITEFKTINIDRLIGICILVLLPIGLVFFQTNSTPVIVALMVCAIGGIILKKEKRIRIPWRVFAILAISVAIYCAVAYTDGGYISRKIDVIFTRGTCCPLEDGWVRTVLDGILTNTPLIGASTFNPDSNRILTNLGTHQIVIILTEYGYLAFAGALLLYVGFFICVFRMVAKTRQSAFAKYTSLFFALSLLTQAAYSLIGLFLLDCAHLNMPFMGSFTMNIMNYLSFGIILMLYARREEPSPIEEVDVETQQKPSFLKKLKPYIMDAIFGIYPDEDTDDDLDNDYFNDEYYDEDDREFFDELRREIDNTVGRGTGKNAGWNTDENAEKETGEEDEEDGDDESGNAI